jgi:hypothetical protein
MFALKSFRLEVQSTYLASHGYVVKSILVAWIVEVVTSDAVQVLSLRPG